MDKQRALEELKYAKEISYTLSTVSLFRLLHRIFSELDVDGVSYYDDEVGLEILALLELWRDNDGG